MYNTANQPRKCIRDLWLHILVVWIWFDWRLSGTCRRRIWPINKPAAAMVELGNDIYNTGQMIIPVVSGSADFEMTIYTPSCAYSGICPPGWQFGYGGTSFATPIQAGEWALIESKVAATTGLSKEMGDVNPLLFLAHNAQQLTQVNPYLSMTSQPMPNAFASSGAENYFDSYLLSLGYTFPVDRNLPAWYATM